MLPFKGPAWNKTIKRSHKQIQDEELAEKLKEHDYLECYCNALMDPPWGGYSIEEQILREAKRRKKGSSQSKPQITGTSSYTYLNKDQKAILGESAVLCTTNLPPNLLTKTGTAPLDHARVSKVPPAHTPSVVAAINTKPALTPSRSKRIEDLPDEILCKIISNLDSPELGTLSEASRRFTILVGPVPCGNAFVWARHRCLIYGHSRRAALCEDCIAAVIARNNRSVCKQGHAAWVGAWQFL